jgi:hypothetical protein
MPALRSFLRLEKLDDRWMPDATDPLRPLGSNQVQVGEPSPPQAPTPTTPSHLALVAPPPTTTPTEPTNTTPTTPPVEPVSPTITPTVPPTTPSVEPASGMPPEILSFVQYILGPDSGTEPPPRLKNPINGSLYEKDGKPGPDVAGRVQQGGIGDCWFVSTVVSLGRQRPQEVVDMIKDNGDGTYTVTFPGAKDKPVKVDYDDKAPGERGADGIWVRVLEQAAAKYWQEKAWFKENSAILQISKGGFASDAITLLTGHGTSFHWGSWSVNNQKEWDNKISTAMTKNKLVEISSNDKASSRGMVNNHCYSVIGYDSKTKTLTLRNPWGYGGELDQEYDSSSKTWKLPPDKTDDGVFKISLDDAFKLFDSVTWES